MALYCRRRINLHMNVICSHELSKRSATYNVLMTTLEEVFSPQGFLIVFREVLELAIIILVLLAYVHQSFEPNTKTASGYEASSNHEVHQIAEEERLRQQKRQLIRQIWLGGISGFVVCLLAGGVIIFVFHTTTRDLWSQTEHYWEGGFSILASIIISVMGFKLLRVNLMQQKWRTKLTSAPIQGMFWLPFITVLREGMEAVVFLGGIGASQETSTSAVVNSVIAALILGISVGAILYRYGNTMSVQWFLICSTCFLYLIAAGLFSKGVWNFELQRFIDLCDGFDVSETGHGPGSYDISTSVWHVNCCNGELESDGPGWMMFSAILGWTNLATYGSVLSYNLYWITVILVILYKLRKESKNRLMFTALSNRLSVDSQTPLRP